MFRYYYIIFFQIKYLNIFYLLITPRLNVFFTLCRNALMFNNEQMADVHFIVGPPGESERVPAHKVSPHTHISPTITTTLFWMSPKSNKPDSTQQLISGPEIGVR